MGSGPFMSAVKDMQDFYCIPFNAIDSDIGQASNHQPLVFPPLDQLDPDKATRANPQQTPDCPNGGLPERGEMLRQIVRDDFEVVGGNGGPAKPH
jgi:hypothetical protein